MSSFLSCLVWNTWLWYNNLFQISSYDYVYRLLYLFCFILQAVSAVPHGCSACCCLNVSFIPGSFKRRYEIRFWRLDLIIHCYHVYTLQSTGDVSTRLKSSLPSFLSILAHFPNQNYQSLSKEYNFNWCWHHTLHLKKKKISSSKVCSKHQGQQQRSSAAWRYRWLACVLVALQVLRTLSPGSRIRQLFPSLPSLPSDWSLNLYINWLGKIYILFVLGRYLFLEATDFFDHLSRTAVRFSDQIMTVNLSQLLTLVRIG